MPIKPKFKDHFHVELSPPKNVYLLSEKGHFVLTGRLYYLLAPLLNGCYTVEEMNKHLQGQASVDEILFGLEQLEKRDTLPMQVAHRLPKQHFGICLIEMQT